MKNKGLATAVAGVCVVFGILFGCGGPAGEKEYRKAVKYRESGNLARARTLLEKSIRKQSGGEEKAIAQNELGIILWELGEINQAIDAFGNSCRQSEIVTEANLNLAIALFYAGRLEEAEFQLTDYLKSSPGNGLGRTYLGLISMKNENWNGASGEIRKLLQTTPQDVAGQNMMAIAEVGNDRTDAAITRLKNIVSTNPDYAPALYNLASIYDNWMANDNMALNWYKQYVSKASPNSLYAGRAQEAINRIEQGSGRPVRNTGQATRWFTEAAEMHKAKQYGKAIEKYKQAVKIDPTYKSAYYNMGLSYFSLKDYSAASRSCKRALEIDSRYIPARYMLAYSLYKEGKMGQAEREVKILLTQQPSHKQGKALLKYISAEK